MAQESATADDDASPGAALRLFGRPAVAHDGRIEAITDQAVAALAAYLVLHDTEAVPLASLAGLNHAEATAAALGETRDALNRLGELLGHAILTASGSGIGFDTRAIEIDVVAFEREASAAAFQHYNGRLLDGIDEAAFQPAFVAWLGRQRRRLHERALTIGLSATMNLLDLGDSEGALTIGGQLLDLEPALEPAHRLMMQAWFDHGQLAKAIDHYDICRAALDADGGRRPQMATTALRDRYGKAAPVASRTALAGANTEPAPVIEAAKTRRFRHFVGHRTTLLAACVVVAFGVLGLQIMESFTRLGPASGPARTSPEAPIALAKAQASVIAVTPFTTPKNRQTPAYLGRAVGQELVRHFASVGNLFVIDLTSGVADPSAITARLMLTGELSQQAALTISSTLVDRQTGSIVWRHKIAAPLEMLPAALAKIAGAFVTALKLAPGAPTRALPPPVAANDMAAYLMARGDAALGDHDRARVGLDRQLARSPGFPAMHLLRAALTWRALTAQADGQALGLAPAAAAAGRRAFDDALAVALAAGLPAAGRLEARRLLADGRHDAGLDAARKAVAAQPNDAAAHATLAELLIYSGDPVTALDHADWSARLAPLALGRIAWLLGLARLGGPAPADAAADFARAARRQAARADLAGFLGQALAGPKPAPGTTRPAVDQVLSRLPFRDAAVRDRIARQLVEAGWVGD